MRDPSRRRRWSIASGSARRLMTSSRICDPGQGGRLVVRGEAGVGKSALLEYVVGAASDMRVLRAAGVESEMELAFASLHQLCAPLLDRSTSMRDTLCS
jgi:predicted ATP-dependent serine protease